MNAADAPGHLIFGKRFQDYVQTGPFKDIKDYISHKNGDGERRRIKEREGAYSYDLGQNGKVKNIGFTEFSDDFVHIEKNQKHNCVRNSVKQAYIFSSGR